MRKANFYQQEIKDKKRSTLLLDIKITMDTRAHEESCIEELVEQMDLTKCLNEGCDAIIFARLLSTLYLHYNIPTDNRQAYFYSKEGEIFVNCGVTPLSEEVRIQLKEIDVSQCLHVKLRNIGLLHVARLMLTQNVVNSKEDANQQSEEEEDNKNKKKCRRTKERRIGHVIQKVIEWRKFYSGTSDESRQHQKYSLEEAAKKVGISKKSLDDYLFQIRLGYRFNFNFNEHYNEKVGILRDFVRQQKKATNNKTEAKQRKRKGKAQNNA